MFAGAEGAVGAHSEMR
ncbi:unnamed protein product, partial [Rotaria sp. Silwood1]